MKKILLDTSFFIDCIDYKIDFYDEFKYLFGNYKIIVTKAVLNEIKKLKLEKFLKDFEVVDVGEKNADRSILKFALNEKNLIVATNDKELRNIFKKNKIKTIYIRSLKKICLG